MAASNNVVLDMSDDISPVSQEQLVFQDIPHTNYGQVEKIDGSTVQTHTFTNFPNPDDSEEDDKSDLLEGKKKQPSFWTFEYYQTYFDVDAKQVLGRILASMYPNPRINYLQTHIRPNPDLYGPFWICTTLVLCIAVSGNLANYFALHSTNTSLSWQYDFHKVTYATAVIYGYWWLMPSLIYGLLWWRGNHAGFQFSELICIYGYSLAIYIPISILFVIPLEWLKWILVMIGMALSGTVLIFTLWPSIRENKKQFSFGMMAAVLLMHGLLAVGFMLYFFSTPSLENLVSTTIHAGTVTPPLANTTSSTMRTSTT